MDNEIDNNATPENLWPKERIKKDYIPPKLNIITCLVEKAITIPPPPNSNGTDSERDRNPSPEDSGT
ncbi:hypothetical protein [Elizabethkingia anophelis]|uniref:hypothetical protein n=1 Tax=Elizabethkingia anophelis TaxID=1117645 RepID=UPI003891F4B8